MSTFKSITNPGLAVTFNPPAVIKKIGGVTITTNELFITKTVDSPVDKTVKAYTSTGKIYLLWSGTDYDNVGQWTDSDVINKIKELIISGL